jgi:hypothetical protein
VDREGGNGRQNGESENAKKRHEQNCSVPRRPVAAPCCLCAVVP